MTNLQEKSLLVHGTEEPKIIQSAKIKGNTVHLYTSETLKKEFGLAMDTVEKVQPTYGKILKLAWEKNIIAPATVDSSSFQIIKKRIFSKFSERYKRKLIQEQPSFVAYYSASKNKIFMILDSMALFNDEILIDYTNNLIVGTVIHEFTHYLAANLDSRVFYNAWPFLDKIYKTLFSYYIYYTQEVMKEGIETVEHLSEYLTFHIVQNLHERIVKLNRKEFDIDVENFIIPLLQEERIRAKRKSEGKKVDKRVHGFNVAYRNIVREMGKYLDKKHLILSRRIIDGAIVSYYMPKDDLSELMFSTTYFPLESSYEKNIAKNFNQYARSGLGQEFIAPSECPSIVVSYAFSKGDPSEIRKISKIVLKLVERL